MRRYPPLGFALLALSAFSACFYAATAVLLRRWAHSSPKFPEEKFPPVTFFRPIKADECKLESNLRLFLKGVEPGDQVLFAVSSNKDLLICQALAREFSGSDISCYNCAGWVHKNPKISKLVQIEALAKYDFWIVLDSDVVVDRAALRAFRHEWRVSCATAISAPYQFTNCQGMIAELDALGTTLSLWPGVAVLRAAGLVRFLNGACMGVRAEALKELGGWKNFVSYLAEDHELGRAISHGGGSIHLATTCISLNAGKMKWRDWMRHQYRVFATYRVCNPWGSLGIGLTHGVAFSLVWALFKPFSLARWLLHIGLLALRTWSARNLPGGSLVNPFHILIVSVCEPVFWAVSQLPFSVEWAGKAFSSKKR